MGDSTCAVSECDEASRSRGWCSAHYYRWRVYGDPRFRVVRDCVRCGTPYEPTGNRQRYCGRSCKYHARPSRPCGNEDCDRTTKNGVYCPRCAARIHRHGQLEIPWKDREPVIAPEGYPRIWVGIDSPHANAQGYAYMHRLVVAERIGRPLRSEETVHHKNGDKLDYRSENLELWAKSHGAGQRVEDLVAHVVNTYPDLVREALAREHRS